MVAVYSRNLEHAVAVLSLCGPAFRPSLFIWKTANGPVAWRGYGRLPTRYDAPGEFSGTVLDVFTTEIAAHQAKRCVLVVFG